jgi:tetratricopeptide (TPR) repeat protein
MGDLWIQVLTLDERDRRILKRSFGPKASAEDAVGYESRIQADPTNVGLHDDVALLYLGLNRNGEAVAHFQASARLKPESAATHFNLGTALLSAGRLDEALAQFQTALRINPNYGLVHNNLGVALLQRGNANEAVSHFAEAVRIDPTNAEAHFNMARTLRARGSLPEALEQFRQVVQLRPDSAPALANLAWLLATAPLDRLRDANQAISLAERAVDLTDRREATALDVLAAAYAAAGMFDRAVEAAESALRLAPPGPALAGIRARQELYRRHKPFLSPVKVSVGTQPLGSSEQ